MPNRTIGSFAVFTTTKNSGPFARFRKGLLFILLVLVLAVVGFAGYTVARHNFHVVSAGKIYRSAQPDADSLTQLVREHGIKSVINLRGSNSVSWYNVETHTSHQLGLEHFDFALSASQEVNDEELDRILATIAKAPKPLLIHCKSGADRTGLVGALYLYKFDGQTAKSAERELTVLRGHFPYLFWRDTVAMDHSFWRYVSNHPSMQQSVPAMSVERSEN